MFAVADGVSIREFARREGCSDTLVRRAIGQGKLKKLGDGTVDSALVGSGWNKTNRAAASGANAGANSAPPVRSMAGRPKRIAPPEAPSAGEVEAAAEELFAEEAEDFLTQVLSGRYKDTGTAERIKENALAAKHLLAARKDAGSLVEIEAAETVLFETQRAQRDAWMNFPTRIGPMLAAELGLDGDRLVEALTVHVHQQLADLGEPDVNFADAGEG